MIRNEADYRAAVRELETLRDNEESGDAVRVAQLIREIDEFEAEYLSWEDHT